MKALLNSIKGDKVIWVFMALLALISFLPVYSASSNLAYSRYGEGNTFTYLVKHFIHLGIGFFLMYVIHRFPYKRIYRSAVLLLALMVGMLLYTMFYGVESGSAKRWLNVFGFSFQPSTFAFISMVMYTAYYMAEFKKVPKTFKHSCIFLWTPIAITLLLILPSNFSSAAFMFSMIMLMVFVAQYPMRYLLRIMLIAITTMSLFFGAFYFFKKVAPDNIPPVFQRVQTWEGRIDRFVNDEGKSDDELYQIERAKTAIASGYIKGLGPGKSVQRYFLPQSSSDFIYAIIIEEYGWFGAGGLLILYFGLMIRFLIHANKTQSQYGKLLIVGLGMPIVFQALINMGVAVELFPTTGQTLPMISSGGSSIFATCISVGIILSITRKEEEVIAQEKEDALRKEAFRRIEERELELMRSEEEKEQENNPMNAVLNK